MNPIVSMFSIEGVKQLKSAFKEIKKTSDTNIKSNINFIRFIERKEKRIIKTFLLKSLRTVVIALIPLNFEKSDLLKFLMINYILLILIVYHNIYRNILFIVELLLLQ